MLSRSNIDGLTDRIDEYIRFRLHGAKLAEYIQQENAFLSAHRVDVNNIEELNNLNKFEAAQLAAIRQEVGMLKVPLYLDALSDTLENEPNVVIFCYYRKTQKVLQIEIEKRFKTKCIVINGNVDKKKRFEMCQDFQAGKTKIILATIGALREGVNLTAGHNVDFVEFDWTPPNMEQALARLHRRGQENAVKVRYFTFDGGIDKYMLRTLDQKNKMICQIMLDKNNVL
jgi:SNF2 family DNA or RNA helicase